MVGRSALCPSRPRTTGCLSSNGRLSFISAPAHMHALGWGAGRAAAADSPAADVPHPWTPAEMPGTWLPGSNPLAAMRRWRPFAGAQKSLSERSSSLSSCPSASIHDGLPARRRFLGPARLGRRVRHRGQRACVQAKPPGDETPARRRTVALPVCCTGLRASASLQRPSSFGQQLAARPQPHLAVRGACHQVPAMPGRL